MYVALEPTLMIYSAAGSTGWGQDFNAAAKVCTDSETKDPGTCIGFNVCTDGIYGALVASDLADLSSMGNLATLGCVTYLRGSSHVEALTNTYIALIVVATLAVCWYIFGRTLFR